MTTALIEQLQAFPARVARFVAGFPAARQRTRPPGGGFSLVEHLCHLRDLEREGYATRIRRILDEDLPELSEIDGSTLALERDYQQQDPGAALRDWQAARELTVALLREHLPRDGQRKGIFGGFGVLTLASLAEGIAAHDRSHWDELQALGH
ncbi:DinB family protein [Piscinibacter sp. XHJ-5]|uniref:DinB family protein n=1 Tax=Piscinibacter sp. XHJ-5 TaxID=3037797 RepID=UPI0024529671|nr:DinB family protein [Piscinibacter sp. XHJ-5]